MYKISFSENQFHVVTETLPDEKEEILYCLAYSATDKALVKHILKPSEQEMQRSLCFVETSAEFDCKMLNFLIKEPAPVVIQIHWHKFASNPWFSALDNKGAFSLLENVKKRIENPKIIQVVFCQNKKFRARYLENKRFVYFDNIETVGRNSIRLLAGNKKHKKQNFQKNASSINPIFEKNVLAFTKQGQQRISKTKISLIGAGGLGSALLYQLIRMGFKNITIIDHDKIEASNCNRLYFVEKPKTAIGKFKVRLMKKAGRRFNRKIKIRAVPAKADPGNGKIADILKNSDLLILAVDNDITRVLINRFAARYCLPLINISTGIFMDKDGLKIANAACQFQVFLPREPEYPCLECCGNLNKKEIQQELMDNEFKKQRQKAGYIANTTLSPAPQVIPLNTIIAGIATWEIASWIAGIKSITPWLYYDAMQNKITEIKAKQNPECSCCSLNENSILATAGFEHDLHSLLKDRKVSKEKKQDSKPQHKYYAKTRMVLRIILAFLLFFIVNLV